jgi:hypothetical protein
MTQPNFAPEARATLLKIYGSDDEPLSNMYDYWFDILQANPADPRVRRHRHGIVDAWLIYVEIPGRPGRHAIEWREVNDTVDVLYVGPWKN